MTLSGTYTQGFTNNGAFRLRVAWSATQNINENYSTVTAHLYIDSLQSWASVYDGTSSACSISINGNTKSFSNVSTVNGNQSKWLGSHTVNVYHNSDGSKQFSISAAHNFDITWNGSYVGNVSVSGSAWLNTIPRATTPTLSNYNPLMGETITINLPRASESFTHYVFHDFWAGTWTKINATAVGTSLQWTVPLKEYAQRMQTAEKGGGRIQVDTYNGGTFIGSKIVNFTATVPASVVPTMSAEQITHVETIAGLAAKFNAYVQSKSKIRATVAGTGAIIDGVACSTIVSHKIEMNGQIFNVADATSELLNTSGSQNIVYTVTDSRGRTASRTEVITVLPYAVPSVASIMAERALVTGEPDDDGTYAKVSVTGTIAPVNNLNDKTYTIRHRQVGTETWVETALDNSSYNLALTPIIAGFDVDFAYEIELVISDYFTSDSAKFELSTAFVLVDYYNGGKGLAFGKVANKNGFENDLMTWFTGGIETIALPVGDGSLAYWQTILGGYYHATLGSVTGQPSPSGLIHVIRQGTDFSITWHNLTSHNIYRLYGSSTTLNGWDLVYGTPVNYAPTLLNAWVNYGDGFADTEYWKDSDNVVHITGLIKGGAVADGTIIFTLPIGFRPALKEIFTVFVSGNGHGRVDVNDNGNVVAKIVNATYTSLAGISFRAAN